MTARRSIASAAGLAAVLAASTLAYSGSLSGELQFDDGHVLADNLYMKYAGAHLRDFLLEPAPTARPVTDFTFALDYAVAGGMDVRVHHATSALLHLAVVALLFFLSRRMLRAAGAGGDGLALAAAGMWGLLPLGSQAVSYLSQRAEVLASLLYVAALLLLLAAERRGFAWRGVVAWILGLAAFGLGMGAKAIVVTLPIAYVLYGLWFGDLEPSAGTRLRPWPRRLVVLFPFVLGAAYQAANVLGGLRGRGDAGFSIPSLGPWRYLLTQARVVLLYLRLVFWPSEQNVDWDLQPSRGLLDPPSTLAAALAVLALLAGSVLLLRWSRGPGRDHPLAPAARVASFGIAWFFALLAPTSSVVPIVDVVMEHRAYLASFGIVLAAASAGHALVQRLPSERARRIAGPAAALAACATLGVALYQRNAVWETRESLWRDSVRKSPERARPHANLGHALYLQGRHEEALAEYRAALFHASDGTVAWVDVLRNMTGALLEAGKVREASDVLENALAASPGNHELMNNLAIASLLQGDLTRAEALARRAMERAPHYPASHNTLGQVLSDRGDVRAALIEFETAASLDPDRPQYVFNLALAQDRLGLRAEACETSKRFRAVLVRSRRETEMPAHRLEHLCGPP